jgi:hypothetical protein
VAFVHFDDMRLLVRRGLDNSRRIPVTGWNCRILTNIFVVGFSVVPIALGASGPAEEEPVAAPAGGDESQAKKTSPQPVRLSKTDEVWVDRNGNMVIVGGEVCLRQGPLEMFACPRQTKEHESIVAVNSKAFYVHAGLLALGAKPGQGAKFEPEYVPATGDEIAVEVLWTDSEGKRQRVRGQEWVRHAGTQKTLEHPWLFVGSLFWVDPETGRRYYQADGGDMICVSNFATAMMDLPIPSSQANEALLFEAFTERIPPRGTKVKLLLKPKLQAKESQPGKKPAAKPSTPKATESDSGKKPAAKPS